MHEMKQKKESFKVRKMSQVYRYNIRISRGTFSERSS